VPVIVHDLVRACHELAQSGQTIVLVGQNLAATLALRDGLRLVGWDQYADPILTDALTDRRGARPRLLWVPPRILRRVAMSSSTAENMP
jgi:hypothetical protein